MIILSIQTLILHAEQLELNLVDFAIYASESNNINILVDSELYSENIVFVVNDKQDYLLEAFEKALNLKGLILVNNNKFYYVKKKETYQEDIKYRAIKLNFVKYEDIQNFLKVYPDIKYEFISTSKILLLASKEDDFLSIEKTIKSIDTLPKQLKLKVTILDTNLDKLKELGSEKSILNIDSASDFFFNLIAYPFSTTNIIPVEQKRGFYSFLKYVNNNGVSEFVSSPILTLSDEKESRFDVVNNIPFKTGTSSMQDTNFRTSNSFDYKDVGLQITVTPHIYSDNNVYLDLELNVSNLISNSDNLPTTSKKFVKQSFHLSTNNILVLTGLNKKETVDSNINVPLLSEIPFLGWLFKYEYTSENNNNLSIIFELIQEEEYLPIDLNVISSIDEKSKKRFEHDKKVNQILGLGN